ncbi:HalOD1 output domain-containing protein [Natronorubrum sp. DTA7]|uniref:HalOD1 output domain-containing protein n=1 Tax=Natronorubrum sp. DTA7 TaxID=3447016 RepID=UPI003F86736B
MDVTVSGIGVEAVEYFQESGTVRTQFDQKKTPASIAIIATLADIMDTDPVELDPLHSTVDSDELEALVRVRNGTNGDTHVTFTHEGHAITVHSYGAITITPEHELTAENYERGAGR